MQSTKTLCAVVAAMAMSGAAMAQKGETVKIAWIDALSGLTAATGQNQLEACSSWPSDSARATRPASSSRSSASTTS